jgi:hypothetical protein
MRGGSRAPVDDPCALHPQAQLLEHGVEMPTINQLSINGGLPADGL